MARIGIITCSNMTNDFACTSFGCLESSHQCSGAFARYAEKGGAQVVGIISCAGCPTLIAPEKILTRVRTLVEGGVDAIHFAQCVENLCPFKKKYLSILENAFPQMEFVIGTHPLSEEGTALLNEFLHDGLAKKTATMADVLAARTSRSQRD